MKILSARRDRSGILGFLLLFVTALIIILIGAAMPRPGRDFKIGDKIEFTHRPGRPAVVTKFWPPDEAAKVFPRGVTGVSGVVEASFIERDAFGREYPKEVAAGTFIRRSIDRTTKSSNLTVAPGSFVLKIAEFV